MAQSRWTRQKRPTPVLVLASRRGGLRLAAFLLAVLVAVVILVRSASAQDLVNPVPADADSLARGGAIYAESCAACHGVQGRGDGPLAWTMVPRPADFRIHMADGHTEAQLFDWLSNGVLETAMPGYADQITVEDRWHIINYLQTFAPAAR